MYRAKRSGGARIIRYSSAADDTRRRLALTTKLRRAIADETIEVHYQPIVDLATGELRKVEALARWEDPEEGSVPPGVFIPIAEASRLIIALGEVVISKVVRQLVAWDAQGLVVPCAAVNVSAAHLRHDRLLATIDAAVEKSGLDPRRLEVEFTESAVMDDFRRAAALIADLRARGIGVAIDDFGTGHSSLARLRDLPVDTVKLDRSFIAPLPEPAARALVDAFLGLARGLSLRTVAEGVETAEQHEQLVTAGCDAAQGYLFARPMPAAQLPGWLADHHARVPAVTATRTARASGIRSGRPRPARRGM
jgi:EAL domain-containing protein (putative c-di-GMP-specific phosphodiesterase class I)